MHPQVSCAHVPPGQNTAMKLCNMCDPLQVICTGASIRCLNGSDVKAETRVYLQQLAKRGLRPTDIPQEFKCTKFGFASATDFRAAEHDAVFTDSWAIQSSHSAGSRASSKASDRINGLGSKHQGKHAQSLSMECVGTALVGCSGMMQDGGDSSNQETPGLHSQETNVACSVHDSMQLSTTISRPGMSKAMDGKRDGPTATSHRKAKFRP